MISIVIPVFNCYEKLTAHLPALIQLLKGDKTDYEIIVVDDGSSIKKDISIFYKDNVKLINLNNNYGKGHAVKKGVMASKGDFIVFMDGDFPFEIEACQSIFNTLKQEADVVICDRTLTGSSYARTPFVRRIGSKVISHIVGRFITPGFYDTQCGMKGFSRKAATDIFSKLTLNGFSFDVEIIYIAIKRRYQIVKVPVIVKKQLSSNVRVVFHGFQMLIDFMKIRLNDKAGKY